MKREAAETAANRAWRHPGQVVACWDGAVEPDPAMLRYQTSGAFWESVEAAGITLSR